MMYQCPYCGQFLSDDGRCAGLLVACPYCQKQLQIPGISEPLPPPIVSASPRLQLPRVAEPPRQIIKRQVSTGQSFAHYEDGRSAQRVATDVFALLAFATGILSLLILPIIFGPICCVCSIISYYRLKENSYLTGAGLRLIGAMCGGFSMLYLLWSLGVF